jgi:pimeloyl-ACP methyl ester carboxylesterase
MAVLSFLLSVQTASAVVRKVDFETPPLAANTRDDDSRFGYDETGDVSFTQGVRTGPNNTWNQSTMYFVGSNWGYTEIHFNFFRPAKNISFKIYSFQQSTKIAVVKYSSQPSTPTPQGFISPNPVLKYAPDNGPTTVTISATNIRYVTVSLDPAVAIDDVSYEISDDYADIHPPPGPKMPAVSDTVFPVRTLPGCLFGLFNPINATIPIPRVVGRTDVAGALLDAPSLVNQHFISQHAKLKIAAWDVDPGEKDQVFLNGHYVGDLQGGDNQWSITWFKIPIDWLNFGRVQGPVTSGNLPGLNNLNIYIDGTDAGTKYCAGTAWVSLEFNATAPIFLVHGIAADHTAWEGSEGFPGITDYLNSVGVPYSNAIDLDRNGSIQENGALLADRLKQLASLFGAKKCHLVVHSKGGNDSRQYLATSYDPGTLQVLSLYTIDTPFHGSVLADLFLDANNAIPVDSSDPNLAYLIAHDYDIMHHWAPQSPGLDTLRPAQMNAFNNSLSPKLMAGVKYYNFAADANGGLSHTTPPFGVECQPLVPDVSLGPVFDPDKECAALYFTLGNVKSLVVTQQAVKDPDAAYFVTNIDVAQTTASFQENDLAVTVASAQDPSATYLGQLFANHSSVKSKAVMQGILSRIAADYQVTDP